MGDLVLLRTRYLSLISSPGKLKPCFVGPFRVAKAPRANAFELELPTTMKVHPVFNFSLLRKFQGKYRLPGPIIVNGKLNTRWRRLLDTEGMEDIANT